MNKKILIISGIIIFIVIAFILFNKQPTGEVIKNSEVIKISLSEISENAKWYNYDSNGIKIKYFAVKADDGSVKTAFDACDVCYKSKKGYRQQGKDMVCNNCGNHYPISGLGTKNLRGGGCWPSHLESKIEGNNVGIKISDIEKGKKFF